MNDKEKITVYVPKTLKEAQDLITKFKIMNIENLDEKKFFFLFKKGGGKVGFCIRHNTWQVCDPHCDLFTVTLAEI